MLLFAALMTATTDDRLGKSPDRVQWGFRVALALVVAIRVWNAIAYDPRWQQGAKIHLGYLRDLAYLRVPASYNGPWNYLLTLFLSAPVAVPLALLGVEDTALLHASLGFVQTILFAFLLVGCYRMGRKLWGPELGLRFTVLVGAFPVVQRIQSMVRPENLLFVLTPWAILLYLRIAPQANQSIRKLVRYVPYLALVLAQALIVAQKISGVVILGTLPAFLVRTRIGLKDSIRLLLKVVPAVLFLAMLLIGVQALLTGRTPFRHDVSSNEQSFCAEGFRPAPVSFFLSFQPSLAWNEPFRDAHRGSMPGILFVDFYGDYWRRGFDALHLERTEGMRLSRARYGVVLSACFGLLWLVSSATVLFSKSAAAPTERRNLFAAAMCLLGCALFLCAASLKYYCPEDGDIAKWEYVVWACVFLPIPLISAMRVLSLEKAKVYEAALLALTLAGLVQCIVTPLF